MLSLTSSDSSRLQGTVLSLDSGHPLAGVQVTAAGVEATTDSAGHFTLTRTSSRLRAVLHQG